MQFAKPMALRPRDRVRVVAPAGPFDRASFEAGLSLLSARYEPVFDDGLFIHSRYLAGDDARRLAELTSALSDPTARAVFCARGGYGSMRLLPELAALRIPLKLLVGFSDITAVHLWLQSRGQASVHGPVITQLAKQVPGVWEHLFGLLEGEVPDPLDAQDTLVPGTVEGPLLGGNLSVLTRLLGTPYLPPLEGAILLLEDVGERPYRLDRMWTHLRLAGVFDQLAGIALGEFTLCEEKDATYSSREVLRELATQTGLPCAVGFPIGHTDRNLAVPVGARVRLDADRRKLEFLEPVAATEAA